MSALALLTLLSSLRAASGGWVETREQRRLEGTVQLDEQGRLNVRAEDGAVRQWPVAEARVVRFRSPPAELGALPKGWLLEDIGQVQGHTSQQDGLFGLRVTGGAVPNGRQFQMAHFAHRCLRGEGELVARVRGVSGPALSQAGVMMRENLEGPGGYAFLAVSPDQHLRFEARPSGWGRLRRQDLGGVTLPIWLKLVRNEKEKEVTAFRSGDGLRWVQVEQTPLACRTEPFPEGSGAWLPKQLVGLALTGTSNETPATAVLDQVALTVRGLLGEYFADDHFGTLRFARPDAKVEFHWGLRSPSPEVPEDHFSVRWLGQLEPKTSEPYRFYVEADNDARLWVDERELPIVGFKKAAGGMELALQAGQKYSLKLEFVEGAGAAAVRLGWSSPSQPLEVIPPSRLCYRFQADSPVEEPEDPPDAPGFAKGVWLRKGSFVAGLVRAGDDESFRLRFAGQETFEIPSLAVARIVWRAPRRPVSLETAEARAGVFLKNGDFLDSEFTLLDEHTLRVRSVLFGQRTLSVENGEVAALVLRETTPTPARWEVRLLNGSVLRANGLRGQAGAVLIEDTSLGSVTLPEPELAEIRRLGD